MYRKESSDANRLWGPCATDYRPHVSLCSTLLSAAGGSSVQTPPTSLREARYGTVHRTFHVFVLQRRPRPDPETHCWTKWRVHLCRRREWGDCSGVGATVLARMETLSPRPPSMPLRGRRCVTAPRLIGEDVCCAPAKRTPSHCLRCQPRRALCPARTTSSGGLRRQGRYRWEWQFHDALSSTASTNSTPGLKNSGLAGGDGGESNSPSKQVTETICYRRSR